jgi:hypothetical protein
VSEDSASISVKRCSCGSDNLKIVRSRVAEDCVETSIKCQGCGAEGEPFEYPYGNPEGAAELWNASQRQ